MYFMYFMCIFYVVRWNAILKSAAAGRRRLNGDEYRRFARKQYIDEVNESLMTKRNENETKRNETKTKRTETKLTL